METFVARQPILDRNQNVFGYELLFRSSPDGECRFTDPTAASSRVISDSAFLADLELLTDGKSAFVNVTAEVLRGGYVTLLPSRLVVVGTQDGTLAMHSRSVVSEL